MKQPAPVYQRIAGHQWRHIWLSGDIHGCLEQLRRKLWHCRFDPWRDLLISVGDVIDRGPQSLRCLQLLEQHWVRAVRGNHEQMAMDALASRQMSLWLMNGGDWFIALADNQQKQAKTALEKCQHLPFILELHSRTGKRSPETIYKILNRKTTAMADPLIAHRIKTLLFRVVDIHNNIFTTAIQVANKKYQREHFIPEVWCRTVKFRRDFTTGE